MPLEHGDIVRGLMGHVQERIDHARKHLAQAEADLMVIANGKGIDNRVQAIQSAVTHCGIVISDMQRSQLTLQS